MTDRAPLTRRSLFSLAGAAGIGLAVTACSGAAPKGTTSAGTGRTPGASTTSTARAKPVASGVTPAQVPLAGGITITVAGSGLDAVRGVTVGGVAAADVRATATSVTFTAPHQAMYRAGDQAVELFTTAVAPVATANQQAAGANGSSANDGVGGTTQADGAGAAASATATPTTAAGTPIAATKLTYAALTDVDRQLAYAMTYWEHYNTAEYGSMNAIGGDCANFVSQTLVARGWKQTDAWYSRDAGAAHSTTWTYCPSMDPWLDANASTYGLTRRSLAERDKVRVGDMVFWDWNHNQSPDHVTIVSEVFTESDGTIRIKSASHNEDGPYRDLDDMITVQHPGGTAWFHTFDA